MYIHEYEKYNKSVQILDKRNRFRIRDVFVAYETHGPSEL